MRNQLWTDNVRPGLHRRWLALLLILCLGLPWMMDTAAYASEKATVKVGFFACPGFNEIGKNGYQDGYDFKYMMAVNGYCGYDMQFTGYDESWSELLDELEDGTIDVLAPAPDNAAWRGRFLYCDKPIGRSYTMLTARADDDRYDRDNPTSFDGMEIGMLRDAMLEDAMAVYASQSGFSYTLRTYDTVPELQQALQDGEVDGLLTSDFRALSGEEVLARFNPQDMYILVSRNNLELCDALNSALLQIRVDNPTLDTELYHEYFEVQTDSTLRLTGAEEQYIQAHRDTPVSAIMRPAEAPLSCFDEKGNPSGILGAYIRKIEDLTGLTFDVRQTATYAEYYKKKDEDDVAVRFDYGNSLGQAYSEGYELTDAYLDVNYSEVSLKDNASRSSMAALETSDRMKKNLLALYADQDVSIEFYDTAEECVDAVLHGDQDFCLVNAYTAQKLIYEDQTNRLVSVVQPSMAAKFSIAVRSGQDPVLLSILNKAVRALGSGTVLNIVEEQTRYTPNHMTLVGFVYNNPIWSVFLVMALGAVVTGMIILALRRKRAAMLREQAEENMKKEQAQNVILKEALQTAEQASHAKSDFLACMSHDIRTPMNVIMGMTRMAGENDNPPATTECLGKISTASDFLLGLINDVLDMAKVESGKVELHPEPYPYSDFLGYLEAVIRPQCRAKDLTFTIDAPQKLDRIGIMDKLRVNQIFFNLLSNAVKYTESGGEVRLTLRQSNLEDGKVRLFASVEDNGIGMSEEFQKHLFEPFTREERGGDSGIGTGLGLSIVKSMVDLMGGDISVESRMDVGSKFTVTLDFDAISSEQLPKEEPPEQEPAGPLLGRKALLCEDHPLNQEIAVYLLEKAGMQVTVAPDGQQGLERFEASPVGSFDVILMDVMMPVMGGYEACRQIRALPRPDAKTIPIVAMTARAYDEDREEALVAGMNAHLSKPINPDTLMNTLTAVIAHAEPNGAPNLL